MPCSDPEEVSGWCYVSSGGKPHPKEKRRSGWFEGITLSHSCDSQQQGWGGPTPSTNWVQAKQPGTLSSGRRCGAVASLHPLPPSWVNSEVLGETSGASWALRPMSWIPLQETKLLSPRQGAEFTLTDVTEDQHRCPRIGRGRGSGFRGAGQEQRETRAPCLQFSSDLHLLFILFQSGGQSLSLIHI